MQQNMGWRNRGLEMVLPLAQEGGGIHAIMVPSHGSAICDSFSTA